MRLIKRPPKANRKRPRTRPSRMVVVVRAVACLAIAFAGAAGFWYGQQGAAPSTRSLIAWADQLFPIRAVEVTEGPRLSRDDLLALLALKPGQGLLSTDVARLRKVLQSHPWIRRAEVHRVFPDTLVVEVNERVPVAVLHAGGQEFLLDMEGALLAEASEGTYQGYPVLTGIEYQEMLSQSDGVAERLRAGITLATLLEEAGANRMEVDVRTPGDVVAYHSGFRIRFGEGAFEDKVDRYGRVFDRWGVQDGVAARKEIEVDLRFQDRIIVRDKGGKRGWAAKTRSS